MQVLRFESFTLTYWYTHSEQKDNILRLLVHQTRLFLTLWIEGEN